jgi:hypothetical protein
MNVFLGVLEAAVFIVLLIGLVAVIGKIAGHFSRYKDIK